ncbi:Rhodanese-like domain family protein [Candida albicans]|uniref:M-phase inducer phosphatase n=1 Tax=Candida albicans TaxID=5476 RepID=A0A8H6F7B0_CANAX|nr:Rhodanese-like domain family protein [Candida albicans]
MLHNEDFIPNFLQDSSTASITHTLRVKRNRPKSSYFEDFSPEASQDDTNVEDANCSSPTLMRKSALRKSSSKTLDNNSKSPSPTFSNTNATSGSPLSNLSRAPLRNLSNFVIPSIEHNPKIEFNSIAENDDIPTNYDSDEEFEDGDTFDTIHLDSPVQRKSSNNNNNNNNTNDGNDNNIPTKIRRFHSMYQTDKEIASYQLHEDNSILKFTNIEYSHSESDLLPRIDAHQLARILRGDHDDQFDEFIIIDCRFEYEFNGGHITKAINISTQEALQEKLFQYQETDTKDTESKKRLIIFHCEFSMFRGPMMAKHLRKCDRMCNYDNYPLLTYPDIAILEGGYKNFYENYPQWCDPQGYVEMKNLRHKKLCESNLDKVRKDNKLTRAKSYQFDQQFWSSSTSNTAHHRSSSSSGFINNMHSGASSYHHRSQSFVTINNEKIIKRQRSTPKVSNSPTKPTSSTVSPDKPIPLANIHRLTRANTISSDQTLFSNKSVSSPMISPLAASFEQSSIGMSSSELSVNTQDFQPPTTSFRNSTHNFNNMNRRRKSLSSNFSSCSINSITSSVADSDYAGSVDSALTEPYTSSSPILDSADYFDNGAKRQNLIAMPISKGQPSLLTSSSSSSSIHRKHASKSGSNIQASLANPPSLPPPPPPTTTTDSSSSTNPSQLSPGIQQQPCLQFQFPRSRSANKLLATPSKSSHLNNNLPMVSPFFTPGTDASANITTNTYDGYNTSTINTNCHGNRSSIIDPINDTPVDFSVPTSISLSSSKSIRFKLHKRSGSLINSSISESQELYNVTSVNTVSSTVIIRMEHIAKHHMYIIIVIIIININKYSQLIIQ